MNSIPRIGEASFDDVRFYYDTILNPDKSTYHSSNDEPTPIDCVCEMIHAIPEKLWKTPNIKILDPCCGNGNFSVPIFYKLAKYHSREHIVNHMLEFNDINEGRLENVKTIFESTNVSCVDYLTHPQYSTVLAKYDLIVANPPYAKIQSDGKRASKNHNLIKDFIEKTLALLKPGGFMLFITPDNWMSLSDRNVLIKRITALQIIHLDIHSAKKYFKKIGSSFTWYVVQNCPSYKEITVSGVWKKQVYNGTVKSQLRSYIPLLYDTIVQSILTKTTDNETYERFNVKTSSDLHRYTKRNDISNTQDALFKHRLIHTPKQTVFANREHKFQAGFKVFISTTDTYKVFVDDCGMTQSIAFIMCADENKAREIKEILEHPLYRFINNICRYGNFNNIRILQKFPVPALAVSRWCQGDVYDAFGITQPEIQYINEHL